MNYLIGTHFAVGFVLMYLVVPRFLKKKGFKTFSPASIFLLGSLYSDNPLAGLFFAILISGLWPVSMPLWIWSEFYDRKLKEERKREAAEEEEIKKNDKYYGLSLEEKIDALKKHAESTNK